MEPNYYKAATIAAALTGYLEAEIAMLILQKQYTKASLLNGMLINYYTHNTWSEASTKWLQSYIETQAHIKQLINESTSA